MVMSITKSKVLNDVDERYLVWLCSLIVNEGRDRRLHRSEKMLRSLFSESFYHFVPNDDNRAAEGQSLRDKFMDSAKMKLDRHSYFRSCSILEMIIALSERMAFQLFNPMKMPDPDVTGCFWEIIDNLNLKPNQSNTRIIHKLNNREYMHSGLGGMFPLEDPREDQRAIEIWYQMMAYINENY